MKLVLGITLSFALVGGGIAYWTSESNAEHPLDLRTAPIVRGELHPVIEATGTLEPEEVVDVGAQVAGKIYSLGRDPKAPGKSIDYGSIVNVGTELAYIESAIYQAHVDEAQASLQLGQADLQQAKHNLGLAEQEWKRADRLRPSRAVSDSDYDQIEAMYKIAKVKIAMLEAAVAQKEAALRLAKTNFDYTVIKSPVQGVIIDRRVNVGQTVVASLNAPSLFLIAKDLGRMQVWASVNEADIGRIRPGLTVRFTVDAFPKRIFVGKVEQIRLNATMTQNVVTYTVVVVTDNSDGALLPYLTANVRFEIDRRLDVLMVPNAALRWRPRANQVAAALCETSSGNMSRAPAHAATPNEPAEPGETGRLWVKVGDRVQPIDVPLGITDGSFTEVNGVDVQEGMDVVVGENRSKERDDPNFTNPFTPKVPR